MFLTSGPYVTLQTALFAIRLVWEHFCPPIFGTFSQIEFPHAWRTIPCGQPGWDRTRVFDRKGDVHCRLIPVGLRTRVHGRRDFSCSCLGSLPQPSSRDQSNRGLGMQSDSRSFIAFQIPVHTVRGPLDLGYQKRGVSIFAGPDQ